MTRKGGKSFRCFVTSAFSLGVFVFVYNCHRSSHTGNKQPGNSTANSPMWDWVDGRPHFEWSDVGCVCVKGTGWGWGRGRGRVTPSRRLLVMQWWHVNSQWLGVPCHCMGTQHDSPSNFHWSMGRLTDAPFVVCLGENKDGIEMRLILPDSSTPAAPSWTNSGQRN